MKNKVYAIRTGHDYQLGMTLHTERVVAPNLARGKYYRATSWWNDKVSGWSDFSPAHALVRARRMALAMMFFVEIQAKETAK